MMMQVENSDDDETGARLQVEHVRSDVVEDARAEDRDAEAHCRPTESSPEGFAIAILALVPIVMAIAIIFGTGSPPANAPVVVLALLGFPVALLWIVIRLLWEPFRRRFPAVKPTDDVSWRRLQIVRLGPLGGFNHCVEIGADADHVHLRLMAPLGWISRPMSIPRSAIERPDGAPPKNLFGMAKVRILGKRSRLPAWVFAHPPKEVDSSVSS